MKHANVRRLALVAAALALPGSGTVLADGLVFVDMYDTPVVGDLVIASPPFETRMQWGPPCAEIPPGTWGPPCIAVYDSPFDAQDGSVTRYAVGDLIGPGPTYVPDLVLAGFSLQNPSADPNDWVWEPIPNDWFDSSGDPVRGYMAWQGTAADGSVHYGWIDVTVTYDPVAEEFSAVVHGLAYQTTPNRPVSAGDISGFCPADLDGDGQVGLSDLSILLSNYGTTSGMGYHDGNLDADGDVDLADLSRLLSAYGTVCE